MAPARVIFLALAASAAAFAQEPASPAGKVVLSNGETFEGVLRLTRGKKLDIYEVGFKRRTQVALDEIARIDIEPETEEMAQGWRFVEESSDKKVKLPFQYPLRKLMTEIALVSGQVLRGHVLATPVYVKIGDDERKFFLQSDQKGDKDQKMEDLVYVKQVAISEPPPPATAPSLRIAANGVLAMRAVDADRDRGYEVRDGTAEGLVPGRYDVFARTPTEILYGLTADRNELTAADRETLQARVSEIEEFFNEREIKASAGSTARARVLLEMRRTTPSHAVDDNGQPYGYIRWELWTLHRTGTTWEIDARVLLFRERVEPGQSLPHPAFRAVPECAGVDVREGTVNVELKADK